VISPERVVALEKATGGTVDLVPNVETAAGLVNALTIAKAIRRVTATSRAPWPTLRRRSGSATG